MTCFTPPNASIIKILRSKAAVWDGNNVNQDRRSRESRFALKEYDPAYYFGICLRMRGVRNFTFRNVTIRNPESYGLQISDAVYFTVENVSFDYNLKRPNMDGIHIDGPARYGCVRNLFGSTNDDMVALNCDDGYACEVSRGGEIRDVLIDGLFADNGYTAVRLLSCGHMLENVIIRNIFGKYRFNVVSFTHHNVHADPLRVFKNVLIDGVFAGKAPQGNSDPLFGLPEASARRILPYKTSQERKNRKMRRTPCRSTGARKCGRFVPSACIKIFPTGEERLC